jgi:hypothetical protein
MLQVKTAREPRAIGSRYIDVTAGGNASLPLGRLGWQTEPSAATPAPLPVSLPRH